VSTQTPQRRTRRTVVISLVIVVALLIAFFTFASLYSDVLWYTQLGFRGVLITEWVGATGFFFAGFILMGGALWLTIAMAYRMRPVYARLNDQMDRYRQAVEPIRRLLTIAIPVVIGIFAGMWASSRWQTVVLFLNQTTTSETDPQFHLPVSFYLFSLPFYQSVVGFASAITFLSLIASVVTNLVYGSLRVSRRELRVTKGARIGIAVTAAVYLILQGISLYLDQFHTVTDQSGLMTGASYATVNATIPGLQILAIICALVALLFVVTAVTGRWRLPLIGTALVLVSALVLGVAYPWIVQRFVVDPSERSLEQPYLERNIQMTRQAYGLSDVQEVPYNAVTDAAPGALRQDAQTTANIRILDPALVSASFAQLQQFKQYYQFPAELDVDRYAIDGKVQDAVTSVRELNQAGVGDSQSWYNNVLVYTHGYGLVGAYGTQRTNEGQPVFFEAGIPTQGVLGAFEPRVYFGEKSPLYSIVGGSASKKQVELDYPSQDQQSQTYTTYAGDGGPVLGDLFTRLVYALKFQSEEILLSDAVNSESQILYNRDPRERVQKAAPYLTLDSDTYPSVVDGRLVWIVDGYTTSADYPYSRIESLSAAIADTQRPTSTLALDNVNYIRNSVKATVDAYSGKVTLYAWDEKDPILATWQKVYPNTVKPMADMSSELMSHVRYPEDLFKAQRAILGQYHVTDAGSFYSRDDAWITPNDPTAPAELSVFQPPYYLTMQTPGSQAPAFSLYSTYIPDATGTSSRNVLTGYLVVDSDAGGTPGKIDSGYGKLKLLTLPKDVTVPGPGQVQNNFNADPSVSKELNLLSQGSTSVLKGNLLTLPVGGGLLYVQPVYVRSTGNTSYPLLKKVLVAFGDKIAFENTLTGALDALFGGDAGIDGSTGVDQPANPGAQTPAPSPTSNTSNGGAGNAALDQALRDASAAISAREAARVAGDWAAYGVADQQLVDALNRALAASGN
jgi:uncharacterized membrane protein (UPF0182 family)